VNALHDILKQRIIATGPISIADYMAECLLHPEHGYYSTRDPFGAGGDFTTAPEISQMFGELLGLSLAQTWLDQGAPDPFILAELGPGRGTLMADVLRATKGVAGFHDGARINLIEASPVLREIQREKLAGYNVTWTSSINDLPDAPLYLLANEFFDALPIRQYIRARGGWRERRVGIKDGNLAFGANNSTPIPALAHRLTDTKDGDMVEICPSGTAIASQIGGRINTHGGVAIIIDYGDWRSLGDTLQALKDHKFDDPLANPGQADLTAHVDFQALAAASPSAKSKMSTQGQLLGQLGIAPRAQTLAKRLSGAALQNHMAAFKRLTDADEMGNLFKAIAFYPVNANPPAGFTS